ncbi:DUF6992 family protein [Aureispira sp. CCB-E]|uniref:DUF6992 family protein n=1 Tax=Aureispira sp. CCB-E TaxID=3051121 RepID=UPI00286865B9|nr:hypothetical protein [Aureispira sp. CCB-E]WMX14796.1 hypothetical protein QP953_00260 [Aureispira sp. CCB-E]
MKKMLLLLFIFIIFSPIQAQTSLDEINQTRCKHTLNGMIAFSSWTGANLIAGTVGVITTRGELQHFFEMNLYFNAINLGLAIPGLIGAVKAKRTGLSFEQSVKEVQKIKTVYLVNGALDFTYITVGFLLREMSKNNRNDIKLSNRLAGYGNSFIVQGGFLLIYDFIEFGVHAINGKRLNEHWDKISISPYGAYGLGMSIQYNFSHIGSQQQPMAFSSF